MEYSAGRFLRSKGLRPIVLIGLLFLPVLLSGQNLTLIGGTSAQRQLASCIEQLSAEDLNRLPDPYHSITIVILERERFLEVKNRFGAHQTKLAFSNLAARRMYLSSDVFRDMDNVLRCIPHELGHFVTRNVYEGNAEIAAERIRKRAQEVCIMPAAPALPRVLSSHLKNLAGGTE
jgi:hypothetical protein